MSPIDYEQARFNMIEQQIRTWEVLDQRVLDLLSRVRREDFVPAALRALAFADLELPLPNGDRMWTPKMEARVVQELALPHASFSAARYAGGPSRTLLDVPLVVRKDDPLRDAGAAMLLGKGAIVGIVVGAVVAVSVISDDDGDGGGY